MHHSRAAGATNLLRYGCLCGPWVSPGGPWEIPGGGPLGGPMGPGDVPGAFFDHRGPFLGPSWIYSPASKV